VCDRRHRRAVPLRAYRYLTQGYFRVLTVTHMGPSAPRESTCEAPLRRAGSYARPRSATATQSGARRSAVALVWHYGVLTGYSRGTSLGTLSSTVPVGQVCAAASGCTRVTRRRVEHCASSVPRFVRLGYLRGTHRVLTAYSHGSFVARRVLHTAVKHSIPCSARTAYSQGSQRVRKGYSQGTQKRYSQGTQKEDLKRVLTAAEKVLRVLAAVFVGYLWAVLGSVCVGHSRLVLVVGMYRELTGYLAGTHRRTHMVLTGYSTGSASVAAGRYGRRQHVSVRLCALNRYRVLQGTARYSRAACVYYRAYNICIYTDR
jgi:hypothetical protein